MERVIIHVDMDAFYASVEIRDNPQLRNKPVVIGAKPNERGVVATCNYIARRYGIHSAMNIKEAYRLCPHAVFMHGDYEKYHRISAELHHIWETYGDVTEYIAWDEGYLDVTRRVRDFQSPEELGMLIKARVKAETGLTCSVGIGYSKSSAKMASEEKKPDGFFRIPNREAYCQLIQNRDIRVIFGIGKRTAEKLRGYGIQKVQNIIAKQQLVMDLLGQKSGTFIVDSALGRDDRPVIHYEAADAKSLSRELTFQQDHADFALLQDVLLVLARNVDERLKKRGLYGRTVTLKITYGDMTSITRSQACESTNDGYEIYQMGVALLKKIKREPVRLLGLGMQNLSSDYIRQLSFADMRERENVGDMEKAIKALEQRYRVDLSLEKMHSSFGYLYQVVEAMAAGRN
ncbi:MAG: DNA polymerase IV [Selenomonas sp.]|uniref:DNA polymerase IV n=1 Tax=Selenomonas sp. TaxID=2053611 RepID=UPI002600F444|nr:DNA polymerase IV [Selenomonas sp.]MCR5757631.1 DNA polymerase IV [Selenomonas sp.]